MSLSVVTTVIGTVLAVTTAAQASIVDPGAVPPVDLPVAYPDPMTSPPSAGAFLPPPAPAVLPPPPAGIGGTPADADPPTEGWTTTTHWVHNGDGTISGRFYLGPQFRHVAGEWLPVETALTTLPTGAVTSAGSLLPTLLGIDSGHVVALTLPGGVVTESWTDATAVMVPSVSSQTVTYGGIATASDLELDVQTDGVKERLVLGSSAAPTTWHFHLSDPNDALGGVEALAGEAYRFTTPVVDDGTYLELPSPVAYEQPAAGQVPAMQPGSAHQTVVAAGDGYDVTLSVDANWLVGRTFPVVLDPTLHYTNSQVTSWEESRVSPANPQCGADPGGCIGYVPPASNPNALGPATQTEKVGTTYNIDARPARGYYKFSTSQVQTGSLINSATMTEFQNGCFGFDPTQYQCNLHGNYNIQYFPLTALRTVNNTYTETAAATGPVRYTYVLGPFAPGTRTSLNFNIKSIFDYWVNEGNTNYGFGQKLSSEPTSGNLGGPSFSGVNDPIAGQRPYVDANWSPPPGAPTNVVASAPNNSSVAVSWTAPASNGGPAVNGYLVTLYQSDGTYYTDWSCVCTSISHTFPSVPYGSYYATVIAQNTVGYGPESAHSNTVTLSPAPQLTKTVGPVATYYGRGQELTFTLHISNPASTAMVVDSVTDTIPAGLVASGTPMLLGGSACAVCTLTGGTALSVGSFTVPGSGAVDIVYKAVALGTDRVCSVATNSARAANAYGASTSAVNLTVCDTMLGLENWWSYHRTEVAAQSDARVNVANGNLVVSATDSTPMLARGHLGYVVRRTYNSQDTGVLTSPGSIGAGWQLDLGEADDLAGAGLTSSGLSVPGGMGAAAPMAVTLIDRDGTRHLFRFGSLATAVSLGSVTSGVALGSLLPRALDITQFANVCVDGTYTAPRGVHLSLYRYVGVSSSGCGSLATGTVLGFAAVRPDRLRTEYSWNGRLLSMVDGSGVELRFKYESNPAPGIDFGRLTTVYESGLRPTGVSTCAVTLYTECRAIRVTYPSSSEVQVKDPAGRVTRYLLDSATPRHLVTVINPPETSGAVASDHVSYTYDGFGDDCDATSANATGQLCQVTDARGNTTRFGYGAAPLGPKRVTSVRDRRNTTTTLTYYASPDYVTADRGTERVRYLNIDALGRVGEVDEGNTSDVYLRQTTNLWDAAGTTCRQPDNALDNLLCRVTRTSFTAATPNEMTNYLYSVEGTLLSERRDNTGGTPASLDTTYEYTAQYVRADGTTTTASDWATGSGAVSSNARPTSGSPTLFVIDDRTGMVSPRGNVPGATYANYRTQYNVARSTTVNPSLADSTASCTSRNSGVLCSRWDPFQGSTSAVTTFTYDGNGQRTSMRTPRNHLYNYDYYLDTDRDLSAGISIGGWLKAVIDPTGSHYVAFGYDRASNVTRTWDRNATASTSYYAFTPTLSGYAESLRGSLNNPWRYVTSERDPIGNTTQTTLDANGNPTRVRPPRGVAAASSAYDTTATYDAANSRLTQLMPAETAANKPTTNTYDAFGNVVSTTDPNGSVTAMTYDSVNRPVTTRFTRGAFPGDGSQPPACQQTATTAADAPLPVGKLACSRLQSYDGVDNVLTRTDADGQVTTLTYDAVHRQTRQVAPRNDGVLTTLRTDTVYDADGNVTEACPPRSFVEGGASTCTTTDPYASHTTYDEAGRVRTVKTYRTAGGTALTTTYGYDLNGNRTTVTDANNHTITTTFDSLDRMTQRTAPRDAQTDLITYFTYDAVGNMLSKLEPGAVDTGTGADGDLTVDGNIYGSANPYVMTTGRNFHNLTLVNSAVVTVAPWAAPGGGRLDIKATGTVSICSSCKITVSGKGRAGGAGGTSLTTNAPDGSGVGPGHGGGPGAVTGGGGGGAGHIWSGGNGSSVTGGGPAGTGGAQYGSSDPDGNGGDTEIGSGGAGGGAGGTNAGGAGGAGGGFVHVTAYKLVNSGTIESRGLAGADPVTGLGGSVGGGGGGGSGGTVWVTATIVSTGSYASPGQLDIMWGAGGGGAAPGGIGGIGVTKVETDVPGYGTPLGRITAYSYDADNRAVDTVHAATSTSAWAAGTPTSDGGRNIRTRHVYDVDGHLAGRYEPRAFLTSVTSPDTRYLSRADYDADGRVSATYAPRYDSSAAADLGLSSTQTAQCPTGAAPQSVPGVPAYPAATGVCVTRFGYDYAGNSTRVTLPTSNGSDNRYLTTTYTDDNLVATMTAPDPTVVSSSANRVTTSSRIYDGSGRPVRAADALGHQTVTKYTADGLVASVTGQPASDSATNRFVEHLYDADGHETRTTAWLNHAAVDPQPPTPTLRVSSSAYYTDGRVKDAIGTGTSATDTARDKTSYVYDNVGNPTQVTSPSANAADATNPSGLATVDTYTYDNLLLTATVPVATNGTSFRRTTYGYDPAGRKASSTVALVNAGGGITQNGGSQQFAYYPDDRMSRQTGRNGETIASTYDAAGHPSSLVVTPASGPTVTTTATYYLDGLVRTVGESGRTSQATYDGSGHRAAAAEVVDATSARTLTAYAYSDAGQVSSVLSDVTATTQQLSYDIAGRVASLVAPNGTTMSRTYNPDNSLATQSLVTTSTSAILARWDYVHDPLGRVRAANRGTSASPSLDCTPAPGSLPAGLQCFDYDNAGRLSQFKDSVADRAVTWDRDGNRRTYGPAGNAATFTYNPDDSMATSQAGPSAPVRHQTYAAFGGQTGDECVANTYDGFDRMLSSVGTGITGCTRARADFTYDALDRQATRAESGTGAVTPGTTSLFYDGLTPALFQELAPDASVTDYALVTGAPVAVRRTGSQATTQYVTDDGQGSVGTATSTAGAVACSLRYDPFGSPLNGQSAANPCSSGSTPSSLLYRAARRDQITGGYQLGARTYDPAQAGFLTPDAYRAAPSAADLSAGTDPLTRNTYTYVNGDPVNWADPDGHRRPEDWLGERDTFSFPKGTRVRGDHWQHDTAVLLSYVAAVESAPRGSQICGDVPGIDASLPGLPNCLIPRDGVSRNHWYRPDLVVLDPSGAYHVYEIKPDTPNQVSKGAKQLRRNIDAMRGNGLNARAGHPLPPKELNFGTFAFRVFDSAREGVRVYRWDKYEKAPVAVPRPTPQASPVPYAVSVPVPDDVPVPGPLAESTPEVITPYDMVCSWAGDLGAACDGAGPIIPSWLVKTALTVGSGLRWVGEEVVQGVEAGAGAIEEGVGACEAVCAGL